MTGMDANLIFFESPPGFGVLEKTPFLTTLRYLAQKYHDDLV